MLPPENQNKNSKTKNTPAITYVEKKEMKTPHNCSYQAQNKTNTIQRKPHNTNTNSSSKRTN